MPTVISHSPEETLALGKSWAATLQPGTIIGLVGDLGAGKTQLVKGLAKGLGISERIHSPTFTLVNVYTSGRLPVYHLDLYRLDSPEQIESAGLLEYFAREDAVIIVEWMDRWTAASSINAGLRLRKIMMTATGEQERQIEYEDFGF